MSSLGCRSHLDVPLIARVKQKQNRIAENLQNARQKKPMPHESGAFSREWNVRSFTSLFIRNEMAEMHKLHKLRGMYNRNILKRRKQK